MRRRHLFEFEDQPWVPASLRALLTATLQRMNDAMGVYDAAQPVLLRALEHGRVARVVDLCSGAGGPWRRMLPRLAEHVPDLSLTLTDRYPQPRAIELCLAHAVHYEPDPVDAAAVPPRLAGVRTIFTGFHHFEPAVAQAILADAVEQRAPIAIFEFTRRRSFNVLLATIAGGLGLPLVVPWLRPFALSHLLWTYVLPLAPLAYAWDGAISNLRTYTPTELHDMTDALSGRDYAFEIGELPVERMPTPLTYLLGLPQ